MAHRDLHDELARRLARTLTSFASLTLGDLYHMVTRSAPTERQSASLFFVFALYLLLAVCLTWPLVTSIASPAETATVPAGAHDVWQNYWNFWWWKTALLERGRIALRPPI